MSFGSVIICISSPFFLTSRSVMILLGFLFRMLLIIFFGWFCRYVNLFCIAVCICCFLILMACVFAIFFAVIHVFCVLYNQVISDSFISVAGMLKGGV